MPQTDPAVDAYLEKLDSGRREALQFIRSLIWEALPDVQESIKHGMPFFDWQGERFALASQKHYMSLYVMDTDVVETHKDELKGLNVGKSCIRFRRLEQLPLDVIRAILKEGSGR